MSPVDPNIEEKLKRSGAKFLSIDIEVALTFVQLARSSDEDSEKKFRNQRYARKAYDKVQELLSRLRLPPEQQSKINEKLSNLKAQLQALGEHF